jgi:hypothetical protein
MRSARAGARGVARERPAREALRSAVAAAFASPQMPDGDLLHEAQHLVVGVDLDDLRVLRPVVHAVLRQRAEGPRREPSAITTSACAISFIAAFEPW